MKRNQKPRHRAGFTLAETLLAVLILLMVSTIVATGVPAARNAYEKVVLGANAQMLLSTAVSALRNELGTAYGEITVKEESSGKKLIYSSAATGARTMLYVKTYTEDSVEKKGIVRQNYVTDGFALDESSTKGEEIFLLTKATATKDMYVAYDGDDVAYDASTGIVKFPGLKVYRAGKNSVLATLDEDKSDLEIRVTFANSGDAAAAGGGSTDPESGEG